MSRINNHECPELDGSAGYFLGFHIEPEVQQRIEVCPGAIESFGKKICPAFFRVEHAKPGESESNNLASIHQLRTEISRSPAE